MSDTTTSDTVAAGPGTRPAPPHRTAYTIMLVSALASLLASLVLSVDAWRLAADPNVELSCNLNAALSCGTVAQAWQAQVLGFPNAFLGLMAEPVVITVAVAGLAGVRFPKWFLNAAMGVYLIGFGFALWLFFQSFVVIGSLCPWCLLVTVSTTTVFTSLLRVTIMENTFRLPEPLHERLTGLLRVGADYAGEVVLLVLLAAAILLKYQAVLF